MKLLLVVVGVLAICHQNHSLSANQKAAVSKAVAECITQEKVSKELVDKVFSTPDDYGKVDKKLQCYTNCFLNKLGFFVNGAVQTAKIESELGPSFGVDIVKTVLAKCKNVKGSDDCEKAFMLLNCFHKEHADVI